MDNNSTENTNRSKVWMQQAFFDLEAANLSLKNGFHEWAAYQAEQAAEKALKAVIVHAGWRPPKMHKLGILFGICNQACEIFRQTKFKFKHLESFTFISRYPFLIPGKNKSPHELIAYNEATMALEEANDLVAKVLNIFESARCGKALHIRPSIIQMERIFSIDEIDARIEEIKGIIVREFDTEKIVLFGRFAREYRKPVSGTMDVLIIAKTDLPFIERIVKIREATRGGSIIIEPLIYTPDEFQLMVEEEGEGFVESALEEGVVLYEKTDKKTSTPKKETV